MPDYCVTVTVVVDVDVRPLGVVPRNVSVYVPGATVVAALMLMAALTVVALVDGKDNGLDVVSPAVRPLTVTVIVSSTPVWRETLRIPPAFAPRATVMA